MLLASGSVSRHAFASVYSDLSHCLAGCRPCLGEIGSGVFMLSAVCRWILCVSEGEKIKIFAENILYINNY